MNHQELTLMDDTATLDQTANLQPMIFSVEEFGFFEGTEKLLELWFSLSKECYNTRGLRDIPRKEWDRLLIHAQCKILSVKNNKKMDAYLLSESSMFVSDTRFILKTCGTTTLINSVKPLLTLVESCLPGTVVTDVFYSHQKFKKPDLQNQPHHSFSDECTYLDSIFKDGAAYALGKINADCWYLYMIERVPETVPYPDQTLEILMVDLDPKLLAQFSTASFSSAQELDQTMGIDTIIPGTIIDSYLFDPCGYSANGIIKDDFYYTIHVTPQDGCSYVSFETNFLAESYTGLVKKILGIFKPDKFTVTVFANEEALCDLSHQAIDCKNITGYKCRDQQFSTFSHYNLTFRQFSRK